MNGKELMAEWNQQIKEAEHIYQEYATVLGLSQNALWILYILACEENGKLSQQEICKQWSWAKQTVNSTVQGLIQRGLLQLEFTEESRKKKYLCLTEQGSAFVKEHILPLILTEERVAESVGIEQMEHFLQTYQQFYKLMQAALKEMIQEKRNMCEKEKVEKVNE